MADIFLFDLLPIWRTIKVVYCLSRSKISTNQLLTFDMTFGVSVRADLLLRYLLPQKYFFKMTNTSSNHSVDIRGMRAPYKEKHNTFTEDQLVSKEPFSQFKDWFEKACSTAEILEPNAMCLATCTRNGLPSARYVLLKGYGKNGFKFFTNYNSRKGNELNSNPNAALVFYWESLRRSIRIEGTVEKLSKEESTEYFHSRPKTSQIGATCSNQSKPVASRKVLTDREDELKMQYADSEKLPKPEEWGGYILKPHSIEFWQGQSDRIHDRIRFRIPKENEVVDNVLLHQGEDGWVYERLQP